MNVFKFIYENSLSENNKSGGKWGGWYKNDGNFTYNKEIVYCKNNRN